MRLRLDEARQRLILTFPRRMSRRSALDWAIRQADWVENQLARIDPAEPILAGALIPFEGRQVRLVWDSALPRTPRLDGEQLQCGGPESGFAQRIERFLRAESRRKLSDATADIARRAGVTVKSVSVGDAATR